MNKTTVVRIVLAISMVALLLVAYRAFTVPMETRKPDVQSILSDEIPSAIQGPPPIASGVDKGKALALMEIPRFGDDWQWVVVEGTDDKTLTKGPGHFPKTALPGSMGNSSFAAHRSSHGDPFIDFDKLEVGDKVFISQRGARWEYEITTAPKIIPANAGWVTDLFAPGRWLTLTTCWPKYGSEKRMFVRAKLISYN